MTELDETLAENATLKIKIVQMSKLADDIVKIRAIAETARINAETDLEQLLRDNKVRANVAADAVLLDVKKSRDALVLERELTTAKATIEAVEVLLRKIPRHLDKVKEHVVLVSDVRDALDEDDPQPKPLA